MGAQYLIGGSLGLVLHEAGHALVTTLRGLRVRQVGICRRGLFVRRELGSPLDNMLIAAAGPAVNLLLCLTWHWLPDVALANAVFAIVYLLPIPNSDGSHIVPALRAMRRAPLAAPAVPGDGRAVETAA